MITSSKISRMPCLSQIAAGARDSPWAARARRSSRPSARRSRRRWSRHRAARRCARARRRARAPHSGWPREKALLARGCGCGADGRRPAQVPEELAVAGDAADRDAAEADAVIAALAADQPGARAFAPRAVIGERDLQRGLDRLRAGIARKRHGPGRPAAAPRSATPPRKSPDGPSGRPAHSRASPIAAAPPRRSRAGRDRH